MGFACTKKKGMPVTYSNPPASVPTTVSCSLPAVISFSTDVNTLISNKCLPCHSYPNSSGINLDSYLGIKTATTNNILQDALTGNNSITLMPPNSPLDSCQIKTITNWIKQGCMNN